MEVQRAKEAKELKGLVKAHSEQLFDNLENLWTDLDRLGADIDELNIRKDVYRTRHLNSKIGYCESCIRRCPASSYYYSQEMIRYKNELRSIRQYPEVCFVEVPDNETEVLKCGNLLRKKLALRSQKLQDKSALQKLEYLFRRVLNPRKSDEDIRAEIDEVFKCWNSNSSLRQHYFGVLGEKIRDKEKMDEEQPAKEKNEEEKNQEEKNQEEKAKPVLTAKQRKRMRNELLRKPESVVKAVQQEISPPPAVERLPEAPPRRKKQNPFPKAKKKPTVSPPPAEVESAVIPASAFKTTVSSIKSKVRKGYAVLIVLLSIIVGVVVLKSAKLF